jgi:hypothetical protein
MENQEGKKGNYGKNDKSRTKKVLERNEKERKNERKKEMLNVRCKQNFPNINK